MKQEDKEKWITAFRESLEDYSEPPLFNDWERLEKELSVVPVAKPKRSYIMYYSAAAAIILLLIASATAIYLFDNSSDKYFETSQLPAEIEQQTVATRLGATFVLSAGSPDAPPIVFFHGSLSNSITWAGAKRACTRAGSSPTSSRASRSVTTERRAAVR